MANEVKTVFTADASALYKVADDVEKRLKSVFSQPAAIGAPNLNKEQTRELAAALGIQQKQLAVEAQAEKLARATLQTEKERLTIEEKRSRLAAREERANAPKQVSAGKPDALAQLVARDVKYYETSRVKSIRFIESEVIRSEKNIAAITKQQNRDSTKEVLENLNKIRAARSSSSTGGGGTSGGGSAFASIAGGSFTGNVAADLAIKVATIVASSVKQGADAWFDYATKLEQTRIGFKTLLGSAEEAEKHLKSLQVFAKDTPFEFEQLTGASRRLQNVGVEAAKVIPLMRDIGNAASAAGASSEDLDGITLAISQIIAKGKVSAEELNQLAERGVPGLKILSDQLGITKGEVLALAERGKISSEIFLQAFQNFSQLKFGDAMKEQSKTFQGALSNIKDAALIAAETAFKPLYTAISKFSVNIADSLSKQKPEIQSFFFALGEAAGKSFKEGAKNAVPNTKEDLPKFGQAFAEFLIPGNFTSALINATGIPNIGAGFAAGLIPKTPSIADLRQSDDKLGGLTDNKNLNDVGKSLTSGERLKLLTEGIEDVKKLNLAYAEQAILIAKANAARTNSAADIERISNLEINAIKQQISIVRDAASQKILLLTEEQFLAGGLAKINRETAIEVSKLETQAAVTRINALQQIAQKEKELAEERKRKAEEYKKQLGEIRDLITNNFASSSQNPYVKIFDDASKAIERARELTKGFSSEIKNAAIQSAQAANGGSFFGQRINTRLEADSLQQQALKFLGGGKLQTEYQTDYSLSQKFLPLKSGINDFRPDAERIKGLTADQVFLSPITLSRRAYQTTVGGGNFNTNFTDEQKKVQEDLRRQINIVKSTPFNDLFDVNTKEGKEQRDRAVNNSIADLVKGLNPDDLSADLRGQAAQALLRQAGDKLKEEAEAIKFYNTINSIMDENGLKVKGAKVTVNAYNGATYDVNGTPTRPAQHQTRSTR